MKGRWAARGAAAATAAAALALALAPAAAASGAATTFTVAGFADGNGSCAPPDENGNSVCPTLRAAADQASLQANFPTIELQAGTYQLTLAAGGQLTMGAFTIQGTGPGGAGGTTIQQTDAQNRVIEVQGGPAKLAGVEITGGHLAPSWQTGTTWLGGGILAQAPLVLQDVLISGNQVLAPAGPSGGGAGNGAEGGGIAYAAGTAPGSVISDSVITGNSVGGGNGGGPTGGPWAGGTAYGGGVAYEGNGPLAIQDTTISQNAATGGAGGPGASGGGGGDAVGGGVFNSGDLTVQSTTINGNTATGGAQGAPESPSASGGAGSGGGIFSENGSDEIVNSTVFGNAGQGGAAAQAGDPGAASGGGILDTGTGSLALQSDTIDANRTSQAGGNLGISLSGPGSVAIRDTILAGGAPDNCAMTGPAPSESNNLEDDTADTCAFNAANHDLVGVNPQLPSSPGNHGGLTQTLAPTPGSPVLGAGGHCLDPTSIPPNQPLSVDQRNLPRSSPCDIGAFEAQPPANTVPPAISGKVARGQTLVCDPGVWTGDGPLSFSFGWLHNGVLIPGASTNTYVVRAVDAGQGLACQVTASYYGSSTVASTFLIAPSFPVITLLGVTASPSLVTVSLGCRGPDGKRCHGTLAISVLEKRRGGRVVSLVAASGPRTVTLGRQHYSILTRRTAAIQIRLRRKVRRLLLRFRKIPSLLSVSQTTLLGTGIVTSHRVRIRRARVHPGS